MPKLNDELFEQKMTARQKRRGKTGAEAYIESLTTTEPNNKPEPDQQPGPQTSATQAPEASQSTQEGSHDFDLDLDAVERLYRTAQKKPRIPRTYYLDQDVVEDLASTVRSLKAIDKDVDGSKLVNDAIRRHLSYLRGKRPR